MSIAPDLFSLKRSWNLDSGYLEFLVAVDWADYELELDDLIEIADGIHHRLTTNGGTNRSDVEQWIPTAKGWTGVMVDAHTLDDGLEWFELFTHTWGDAFDGTIVGGSTSRYPHLNMEQELTAFVAYTTNMPSGHRDDGTSSWDVDGTLTRDLAERAAAWAYFRGCRQYFSRDSASDVLQPEGLEHALAFAQAVERHGASKLMCASSTRRTVARLAWEGRCGYQVRDTGADWRSRLADVRATLTWAIPHTDLAFVTYSAMDVPIWNPDIQAVPWPHLAEHELRYNRALLSSYAPDAYGIQVLTSAHLGRANDLRDWQVTSLGGEHHLVEATDLAAWFENPQPAQDLLDRARADFGDMILTSSMLSSLRP